ncbi:MAG: signal peptidase I [Ruminococcus sp.]|nr:signal peptidase I [Ruminococcus sp.]
MSRINKGPPEKKGYLAYAIVRKIILYLFCAGIIIAAILFAVSKTSKKSIFGYRYYTVKTPSMEPKYKVGDLVFVKVEGADKIEVGDVITFNPSSGSEAYLTHRVTQKMSDYQNTGVTCFRTKGDANDAEDSFLVDEDRVIGAVKFRIPKLGYIIRFIQLRWYFILPLALMLWMSLRLMKMYFSSQDEAPLISAADNNETIHQEISEKEK